LLTTPLLPVKGNFCACDCGFDIPSPGFAVICSIFDGEVFVTLKLGRNVYVLCKDDGA